MTIKVYGAEPLDVPLIRGFIWKLAEYEKLEHEVKASEGDIARLLFGATPRAFCEIARIDGAPVGFAFWFYSVSTFEGRAGIHLEDLYVTPQARGKGAGKALLAHLAQRCQRENLARLEWAVLDWNAPSIAFYDSLGAATLDDWTTRRLTGEALLKLAQG